MDGMLKNWVKPLLIANLLALLQYQVSCESFYSLILRPLILYKNQGRQL